MLDWSMIAGRALGRTIEASRLRRGPSEPIALAYTCSILALGILCPFLSPHAILPLVLIHIAVGACLLWAVRASLRRLEGILHHAVREEAMPDGAGGLAALGKAGERLIELVSSLQAARRNLVERHVETVKAMALAMEARDSYTQGHCLRVRYVTRRILERLGVTPSYREAAETAALLHDLGKIGVPDALLLKTEKLTPEEYMRVMLHVEIGVEILQPLPSLRDVSLFVKHHHERFDGTGYPDGLKGEGIPLASRVIAVADTIDAMRSTRSYRRALSIEETIAEIRRTSGRQFDPKIVGIAIDIIAPRLRGPAALPAPPAGDPAAAIEEKVEAAVSVS